MAVFGDLFALCYPTLDDICGQRVRSSTLSHGVRPSWGGVDDTDVGTKELLGVLLARIVCWGHIDEDCAVLSHGSSCAGCCGVGASEKRGSLYSTSAVPGRVLVVIYKIKR